MHKIISSGLMIIFISISLAACGGGGGSSAPSFQPTKAIVSLSTSGTLTAGTVIGGVEVEVELPAGVSVKASIPTANPAIMETDNGVVMSSGTATGADLVQGMYIAAPAPAMHNMVNVFISKSVSGFTTGNFATVNCDIATGYNPPGANFHINSFRVVDLNGATISSVTVGLTAAVQ